MPKQRTLHEFHHQITTHQLIQLTFFPCFSMHARDIGEARLILRFNNIQSQFVNSLASCNRHFPTHTIDSDYYSSSTWTLAGLHDNIIMVSTLQTARSWQNGAWSLHHKIYQAILVFLTCIKNMCTRVKPIIEGLGSGVGWLRKI